jgi:hypothetical protein
MELDVKRLSPDELYDILTDWVVAYSCHFPLKSVKS